MLHSEIGPSTLWTSLNLCSGRQSELRA